MTVLDAVATAGLAELSVGTEDAGVEEPIVFPLPFGDDPTAVVDATLKAAAAAF